MGDQGLGRYLLHRYALDSWDPATGSASHCRYANIEEKKRPTGINGPWTWPWWPFLFLALPGFGKDSRTLHCCAAHTGLQDGRVRIIGAKYGSAGVEVREITSSASVGEFASVHTHERTHQPDTTLRNPKPLSPLTLNPKPQTHTPKTDTLSPKSFATTTM